MGNCLHGSFSCSWDTPLLPVIISCLLSSRWEETTSPMVTGEPHRSCKYPEWLQVVLKVLKTKKKKSLVMYFPAVSNVRAVMNASLPLLRGARLRRCCVSPERRRTVTRGNNSPPVWRRWRLVCLTVAGHTLWESSLVQRVQSAQPRVWPEAGA